MTSSPNAPSVVSTAVLPTRVSNWTTNIVLLGTGFVALLAMSGLTPVLPRIEEAFAGEPAAGFLAKTLVTVVGLSMVIVSPLSGYIARRFGRVKVLAISLALFIVAGTSGFFIDNLGLLIASRFLTGTGAAAVITLVLTLIGDLYEGRARERRIGINVALGALSITFLAPLAGWLGDHSWQWAFLLHLLGIPFLIAIPFARRLRDADHAYSVQVKSAAARPPPWGLAIFAVLAGSIIFSVPVFVPYHMRDLQMSGGALAGSLFSLVVLASVATSFNYAEIRRVLSPFQAYAISFAVYFVGLMVVATGTTYGAAAIGMIVAGAGGGLITANTYALAAQTSDVATRPRDVGIIKGAYYMGLFVGPTVLQPLAAQRGADAAIFCLAGLCVVLSVFSSIQVLRGRGGAASGHEAA